MAEEKKEEKKEEAKAAEKPAEDKEAKKAGSKRKLGLILGISLFAVVGLGGGGFFVYKTFFGKKVDAAAMKTDGTDAAHKDDTHSKDDKAKDDKKDTHDDKAKDEHKDKAADAKQDDHKGDKKDDKKEEKKDDAKKDDHGKPDDKKDAKADGKADAHGSDKKDGKDGKADAKTAANIGQMFDIQRMDLNLGNPIENRYLRISISLEYKGGENQQKELKAREPQLKDLIITTISTRTALELRSYAGKQALREELSRKINELSEQPISAVYFTEFVLE